jgi:hypothetical protein
MGTRHLYWILTGPSFAVHIAKRIGVWNEGLQTEIREQTPLLPPPHPPTLLPRH